MSVPTLSIENLVKAFGDVEAVRGVSLSISPGEVVAFLGPNGAGKTTTLDIALGLSKPTSGDVALFGTAPRRAIKAGRVSAVLQTGGLLLDHTVENLVRMVADAFPKPLPWREVMDRTNLTEIAKRRVRKCSGGEQQRVRLALALLPDPSLIVLDEPTTGMDVTARRRFWDSMHAEAERGKTIVFATHYLAEAEMYAERTVIMNRGKIVADGPTNEIRGSFGAQTVTGRFATKEAAKAAQASIGGRLEETSVSVTGPDVLALNRAMLDLPEIIGISVADVSLEEAFEELTGE